MLFESTNIKLNENMVLFIYCIRKKETSGKREVLYKYKITVVYFVQMSVVLYLRYSPYLGLLGFYCMLLVQARARLQYVTKLYSNVIKDAWRFDHFY